MSADYTFQRLIDKGYSPQAASAIVGRFQQESGPDLNPLAVHDKGTGFGIAGWRDPKPGEGRKTNLLNWAKDNDLDPNDLDTQIDFFDHEVNEGDEAPIGEALRNAASVEDATAAMIHYERPQGYDEKDVTKASGYENTLNNARSLLSSFTGDSSIVQPEASAGIDVSPDDSRYNPELDSYDTTEEPPAAEDDNYDDPVQEKTGLQKAGASLARTGEKLRDASEEPLDYTPGGENMEVAQNYDQGIPVDAYQQYTPMYADGGVVGERTFEDYIKMLGF